MRNVDYRDLFPKPDKCPPDLGKREEAPIGTLGNRGLY